MFESASILTIQLGGGWETDASSPKPDCSATFQGRVALPLHEAEASHYVSKQHLNYQASLA